MIMAEDCSVNFPVGGLTTRLQGLMVTGLCDRNLTLRKQKNASLFRAKMFNKTNIMEFFDNYERALKP
jgi:hypothetical protein